MISKKINYINPDTNINLELLVDKKMTFVYGKNGCGKTTLSRSNDLSEQFVFNEDFIHKNIYIIESDGAKIDSNTKNNFSSLLIGEDIIELKKKQIEVERLLKLSNEKIIDLNNMFQQIFSKEKLGVFKNPLADYLEDNFEYNFNISYDEQCKIFVSKYEIEQKIKNDEDLRLNINQVNQNYNLKNLFEKIKSNKLLFEWLFNQNSNSLFDLNKRIKILNDNTNILEKLENIAKNRNIKYDNFNLIKNIIEIQEKSSLNACVLCGKDDPTEAIKEWKKIINDDKMSIKENLIKELEDYFLNAKKILEDSKLYINVAKETLENIKLFTEIINEYIDYIKKGNYKTIIMPKIETESIMFEENNKINSISNYLIKNYKDEIIFCNSSISFFQNQINTLKKEIEEVLRRNADNHTNSINTILNKLGFDKEISLGVDRLGGTIKYILNIKKGKINTLSDGQKHKLALAIFLNYISQKNLENKIVLFDDPVVALDEYGYHQFKNYLINEVMTTDDKCPNLVILTHNFNYLYIQLSNIITNESLKSDAIIYKMTSEKIKTMDIELFKLDDIALFKNAINMINNCNELILISSLYNKIFREFLDLKLRIMGKILNDIPKEEINMLPLTLDEKDKLIKQSDYLCKCSKKTNISIDEAKKGFKVLHDSLNTLGYNDYISNDELDKIMIIDTKICSKNVDNDLFFIIKEISELLRSTDSNLKKYKDYLNHPRISFTKNILSTSLDI